MSLENEDLRELTDLVERALAELRVLRAEAERHTALLRQLLERLASLERTQYS